jgi:hypothetical protein
MIGRFEIVFHHELSISKAHLFVKLETFHIYPERARDTDGVVERFVRPVTDLVGTNLVSFSSILASDSMKNMLPHSFLIDTPP